MAAVDTRSARAPGSLVTDSPDLTALLDAIPDAIALVADDGVIVYANASLEALCGYEQGGLDGERIHTILPNAKGSTSCLHRLGNLFPALVRWSGITLDGRHLQVCVVHDETEQLAARADLYNEARRDHLTGLANRTMLDERLDGVVASTSRPFALLYVDVDKFKEINDRYGHLVGDSLLKATAGRLQRLIRPGDTVARQGGDEFALVCLRLDETTAHAVGERIVVAMRAPVHVDDQLLNISMSIGIAVVHSVAVNTSDVLRAADESLYQAKRMGRACCGPVVALGTSAGEHGGAVVDLRDIG